ncbi:MAG: hypothetical protein M3464_00625 [Chloroflexota bacterium]|nr:hypothetical protein [Chloroflexota bacterium]
MRPFITRFFVWYERNYALNIGIAAFLFLLQLVHLYWLTTDVVAMRLTGESWFSPSGPLRWFILIVDYTEIPALFSVSLVYINELRKGWNWKSALFLLFLNSQWLHIFWITDEFVVAELGGGAGGTLPVALAWAAIAIDYLELPVIYDTMRKFAVAIRERRTTTFLREELR